MLQRARLGMAMFLLNEAVFFFMLIAAFVYFRNASGPEAARNLSLGATAVYTACLAASSFTMWRASVSAMSANPAGLRAWLGGTIALGCVFLAGQGFEYTRLFQRNITVSQSVFGTTFFTLTGFHGLHVLAGILLLAILLFIALTGAAEERQSLAVQTVAMFWHFVDLVWIAIFSIVYLWTFA